MKTFFTLIKGLFALLLALTLLSGTVIAAEEVEQENATPLEDQFSALVAELVPNYSTVALGYKNTVTGEEHYYNGDEYMIGASLYKTPLNMIYAERIGKGELSFDDVFAGLSYRQIQSESLTYSANPPSLILLGDIGDWRGLRQSCAEYLGQDPTDEAFLSRTNRFSAREMVHCMNLLEQEKERFPGVLDCLLLSAPEKFLKTDNPPYEIAQKYGNLFEEATVLNASGIIYTPEPIAVCIMSFGPVPNALFSEFVSIVTAYTEESIIARQKAEALAEQERLEKEQAEQARLQAEQAQQERLEKERAERERLQAEQALSEQHAQVRKRTVLILLLVGAVSVGFTAAVFSHLPKARSRPSAKNGKEL